jgi:hypothetical protein
VKNGVEAQLLSVHRSEVISDGDFYQLQVSIQGVTETTSCLTFDASASDVQSTLNGLPILSNNGGVFVTRSDTSTGFTGDAHYYKVYFSGTQLVGDVDEMVAEPCSTGVASGADSTNSHVHVRTLIQGGSTEHQVVSLASDSGHTNDTPAFQLSISDSNGNSWASPCYNWGVPSLDISSQIDIDSFDSSSSISIASVTDLGGNRFNFGSASFIEGVVVVGDFVNT